MRNIQNRPTLNGNARIIGPAGALPIPIPIDPVAYRGAIVAGVDGELYHSDGSEWKIFTDLPPVARPAALTPTTEAQRTQLRLSDYVSFTGLAQAGAYFEVSLTSSFDEVLFERTVLGEDVTRYQLLYPEDPLTPGAVFFWRARYFAEDGAQSQFSNVARQTYPGLISTPAPDTPANETFGAVRLTPFFSAFGITYTGTEIAFIDDATGEVLDTALGTLGAQVTIPGSIPDGIAFRYRGRYRGQDGANPTPIYSDWSVERTGVSGSVATSLTYDLDALPSRTVTLGLNAVAPYTAMPMDVFVDWGDGTTEQITTPGTHSHTYAEGPTEAVIEITGTLAQIGADTASNSAIKRLNSLSYRSGIEALDYLFSNADDTVLEFISNQWPETITSLSGLFFRANMPNLDISALPTRTATTINRIFYEATVGDVLNGWDVSKVEDFSEAFVRAEFEGSLFWDTSQGRTFDEMFYQNSHWTGLGLGLFDMRRATSGTNMLFQASEAWRNGDVYDWELNSLVDASALFARARPLPGGSSLSFPVAEDLRGTFSYYNSLGDQPDVVVDFSELSAPLATDYSSFMFATAPVSGLNSLDVSEMLDMTEARFRTLEPLPDWKFNKHIKKTWNDRAFEANSGFPTPEIYMRTIIGWADTMARESGPTGVVWDPPANGSPYPGDINYEPSKRFPNGAAARAFLTAPVGVVVEGLGTAGDTVYAETFGSYVAQNGWAFTQEGGLWTLRDDTLTLIGRAASPADTPPEVSIWSDDLGQPGVGVFMSGMGWTITGDSAA